MERGSGWWVVKLWALFPLPHRSKRERRPRFLCHPERSGEAWAESKDLQYPVGFRGGAQEVKEGSALE